MKIEQNKPRTLSEIKELTSDMNLYAQAIADANEQQKEQQRLINDAQRTKDNEDPDKEQVKIYEET